MAGTNPRAARIAALIQRVVASSIERELHDKRLASITVTEVRVTNDLQIAKVYWTQLGHEGHEEGERKRAQQALDQAKGHLRSLVGHKAGLRLTPQLQCSMKCPARLTRSKTYSPWPRSVMKNSPVLAPPPSTPATPIRTSMTTSPATTSKTTLTRSSVLHTTPSGLLIIDKPQGVTSFDAVAAVRGALHIKKVGHAGTLDPMATGTLVIAFGHATRLLNAIVAHDKTYEATIRLGLRTTTDDAEGEVLVDGEARSRWQTLSAQLTEGGQSGEPTALPTASWQDLLTRTIATNFTGDIEQVPNTFSAIKINGQRAYDLAREGKDVELKPRPVTISEFTVLDIRSGFVAGEQATEPLREDANTGAIPALDVDVRISCSSGTYIRALARDLGKELGVGGYLTRLRRTRVGRFALPDDASGLIAPEAMLDTRTHTVTAHTDQKTFTNREGQTVTRNKCVLDTPEGLAGDERRNWLLDHALTMEQAARGAMPALDITPEEASELRFGRRIERTISEPTAAIVPQTHDVAAIIERANAHQAKPVTVFPLA